MQAPNTAGPKTSCGLSGKQLWPAEHWGWLTLHHLRQTDAPAEPTQPKPPAQSLGAMQAAPSPPGPASIHDVWPTLSTVCAWHAVPAAGQPVCATGSQLSLHSLTPTAGCPLTVIEMAQRPPGATQSASLLQNARQCPTVGMLMHMVPGPHCWPGMLAQACPTGTVPAGAQERMPAASSEHWVGPGHPHCGDVNLHGDSLQPVPALPDPTWELLEPTCDELTVALPVVTGPPARVAPCASEPPPPSAEDSPQAAAKRSCTMGNKATVPTRRMFWFREMLTSTYKHFSCQRFDCASALPFLDGPPSGTAAACCKMPSTDNQVQLPGQACLILRHSALELVLASSPLLVQPSAAIFSSVSRGPRAFRLREKASFRARLSHRRVRAPALAAPPVPGRSMTRLHLSVRPSSRSPPPS